MRMRVYRHNIFTLAILPGLVVAGFLIIASNKLAAQSGSFGTTEQGTFAEVTATSGSETGPHGGTEPVIKPNAEIEMQLSPSGGSHNVTTDAGGNFSFDRQQISEKEASQVKAELNVPICTWKYKYPRSSSRVRPPRDTDIEQERVCEVNHVNTMTIRWRRNSSDAKIHGQATSTASITLDSGKKIKTELAEPAGGGDAGSFEIAPIIGDYIPSGNGVVKSTIINTECTETITTSDGETITRPVTPTGVCGGTRGSDQELTNKPQYIVYLTIETKNTTDNEDTGGEDPSSGLPTDEVDQLSQQTSDTYVAGLKNMTAQFTSTMFQQAAIVGSFFDAWGQQNTQRTLQRMQAEAVKDYMPSKTMCRFGSLSSSQAGTAMKMQANQLALNDYMQGRELSQQGRNAGAFAFKAGQSRLRQFKQLHCFDQQNSRNGLATLCGNIAPTGRDYADSPDKRYNRDIDYTRLLATNNTLNFDMTDSELTADEEDIMALSRRLYAQDTFSQLDGKAIGGPRQNYYPYMRVRSINAARSVARNSFTDYVAKKARGSGNAAGAHMRALVEELGLSGDAADKYIGTNPSYHAQMDVLNKKIYQDPGFVANLYDTPTNVTRQHVFMYARKLIQRREIYKTLKRREMMLASLLEMRLRDVQNEVNTRLPLVGQSLDVSEEDDS